MKNLDKETQIIAVEKVLEEMQKAEEYVKNWNACWYERLLDAHCLPLHYEIGEADVRDMERKYEPRYQLANAYYSGESIGIPLAKETLVGDNTLTGERNINFECEFGRIDWYGMTSHKSKRFFSFNNNGEIYFSKDVKRKKTSQHPRHTSYNATFNVLSNDFTVNITLDELTEDWKNKYKYDYITISLCGNILTKKLNDIEIIEDLNNGMKLVRIVKKYNNQNRGDIIVSNFANSTQNAIAKNLSQRVITFDSSDFNMETVKQTESMVIEMVKNIKGELPLSGLVERIDNCLELINKQHNLEIDGTPKTLKLESKN